MKKVIDRYLILALTSFLLTGCLTHRRGFYLSPLNSQINTYHTIPFKSDSIKTAFYGGLIFSNGNANDQETDKVWSLQASIYRSHNLGNIQLYYGGDVSAGKYGVYDFYNLDYSYSGLPADTLYHIPAHNYSFGSYGLSFGINLVRSFSRGEWRYLGFESTMRQEFGDYRSFRSALQDSAANIIFRKSFTGTTDIFTEILWANRHHTKFGFKFSFSILLNPKSDYTNFNTYSIYPISYLSMTYHITVKHITGFIQGNVGTQATSFQFGTNYRIGK